VTNLISKKIRFFIYKRTFDSHRLGRFWCDKHWAVIKASLNDPIPINPAIAAIGVTTALYLKDIDSEAVRRQGAACCWVKKLDVNDKKILEGIFERSRGWN
jgi:hypothetical protein